MVGALTELTLESGLERGRLSHETLRGKTVSGTVDKSRAGRREAGGGARRPGRWDEQGGEKQRRARVWQERDGKPQRSGAGARPDLMQSEEAAGSCGRSHGWQLRMTGPGEGRRSVALRSGRRQALERRGDGRAGAHRPICLGLLKGQGWLPDPPPPAALAGRGRFNPFLF